MNLRETYKTTIQDILFLVTKIQNLLDDFQLNDVEPFFESKDVVNVTFSTTIISE